MLSVLIICVQWQDIKLKQQFSIPTALIISQFIHKYPGTVKNTKLPK